MSSERAQTAAPPTEPLLRVRGVSKCYQIYRRPVDRLLQGLIGSTRKLYREFWALDGVDFEVRPGETMGIVGRNGSGKSTLLQLIAGTLAPTAGEVDRRGRVAALLELGSGFNPDFSGRENVYLNASILGLDRAQIDSRYADIVAFADIGPFIDQPVSTYSTGMVMRLAFAVMAHVDADVLILDEVLAVGDAFFTQKCMRFLRQFKQRGTLLFVSHDSSAVSGLCDRAVWLEQGRQQMCGPARDVVNAYLEAFMFQRLDGSRSASAPARANTAQRPRRVRDFRQDLMDRSTLRNDIRVGEFEPGKAGAGRLEIEVLDVVMLDDADRAMAWILGGESVTLEVVACAHRAVDNVIVGFYVKDRLGQLLFGDNTWLSRNGDKFTVETGERFRARFAFDMPRLQAGDYVVTVGVAEGTQDEHVMQHWLHEALAFKSLGEQKTAGLVGLPMRAITLQRESRDA